MSSMKTKPASSSYPHAFTPWVQLQARIPALEDVNFVYHTKLKDENGVRWKRDGWVPDKLPRTVHVVNRVRATMVDLRRVVTHESVHATRGGGHGRAFWRMYVARLELMDWIRHDQADVLRAHILAGRLIQRRSTLMMHEVSGTTP